MSPPRLGGPRSRSLLPFVAFTLLASTGASVHCAPTVETAPAPLPEGGTGCAADPLACPAGQTCWPVDSALDLACITSRASGGDFLATCDDSIGLATCGSGLACDAVPPKPGGVCTYYCDAAHPCPNAFTCEKTRIGGHTGPVISVCRAAPDGGDDAGADGG